MSELVQPDQQEIIQIVGRPQDPMELWSPKAKEETFDLLAHLGLPPESSTRIRDEAVSVLARCIPPNSEPSSSTGLVIGYVQSGKTLSFTTVTALARDNGYPMVIIITGIGTNLLGQSAKRLENDLRLAVRNDRKWHFFLNPKQKDHKTIQAVLDDWQDHRIPESRRKTVLITVLKNHAHLRGLIQLLTGLDLTRVPVLIIDDEADQAGLNTFASRGTGQLSSTYQRLVALRASVPHHTYLQYTATPQAPLLINLIDILSPHFAEILTPGPDYTGGREFFGPGTRLIRVIPPNDIPGPHNAVQGPPETLLEALRLFFLGVAAGYVHNEDQGQRRRNRSMLVHPSQETRGHNQFYYWVTQVREQWMELLHLDENDPERIAFLEEFRPAYDDVKQTASDLPPFDELAQMLHYALRTTLVQEVNASQPGGTPEIDWKVTYPFILVGGQAMDRGYTVEGLTITYMPRSLGVGNADTVQQRARFFGYKRPYLGYCRVFLTTAVRDAFEFYVEHEEDIRRRLFHHRDKGQPLSEWRRAFFLNTAFTPTRKNVLQLASEHDTISDDWYWPKTPHGPENMVQANRDVIASFTSELAFEEDEGDARRTEEQKHLVAQNVSLRKVYEDLLSPIRLTEAHDSERLHRR